MSNNGSFYLGPVAPVCDLPGSYLENATTLFVGNKTFYQFNTIFSGACAALASVLAFVLIFLHGTHFSKPAQQMRIIRITMFIPVYSVYTWLCIYLVDGHVYLEPWLETIQAIALGNFFLLLLEMLSPDEDERFKFLAAMDLPATTTGKPKKDRQGNVKPPPDPVKWYKLKWLGVTQLVFVSVLVGIITCITEAANRYCEATVNPKFAHIWMEVIINVSLSWAIVAVLMFYQSIKVELAVHRPLAKLIAFKGIITFTFISGILFLILNSTKVLIPNATLTYADVKIGIPMLVQLIGMVFFSCFFHWAYSHHFYVINHDGNTLESGAGGKLGGYQPTYQGGFLGYRAYLYAMNPAETIQAYVYTVKIWLPGGDAELRRHANHVKGKQDLPLSATGSNSSQPGMEPLRHTSAGNDYAVPMQQGSAGYNSVPNPAIQEPVDAYPPQHPYGQDAYGGRRESHEGRGHSRTPSREHFLPPGQGRGHGRQTSESYRPLADRDRY